MFVQMRTRQQHWLPFHPVLPNGFAGMCYCMPFFDPRFHGIPTPYSMKEPGVSLHDTSGKRGVCLPGFVKFFTSYDTPIRPSGCPWLSCGTPYAWHVPGRTIRRVHVMPWATPMRRIGQSLAHYNGPGGEDPNAGLFDRRY